MAITISATDTSIDLCRHVPSDEVYALRFATTWNDDECVGLTITGVVGPLRSSDYEEMPEPANEAGAWLREQALVFDDETAEWANAQQWRMVASTSNAT